MISSLSETTTCSLFYFELFTNLENHCIDQVYDDFVPILPFLLGLDNDGPFGAPRIL